MEAASPATPQSPNHAHPSDPVAQAAEEALALLARRWADHLLHCTCYPRQYIDWIGQIAECQRRPEAFAGFARAVAVQTDGIQSLDDWEWVVFSWVAAVDVKGTAGFVLDERQTRAKRKADAEAFAATFQADLAAALNRDPREPGTSRLMADLGGATGGVK